MPVASLLELHQASREARGDRQLHDGVERTYAMQAGREVHVMVQPDKVSDAESTVLAHDIAQRSRKRWSIGQVRVVVIRESRAVDIA